MPAKTYQNNPTDPKELDKLPDDAGPYFVVPDGTAAGNVLGHAVVPAKAFGPSAEIGRMVRLGAIREATAEEIEEYHKKGATGDPLIDRYNPRLATGATGPAPPAEKPSAVEAVSMPVAKDDKGQSLQSAAQAARK